MRFNRTIVAIAMCALFAIVPTLSACADNDTPITVDKLPVQAQTFLKTYFGDKRVAYATKDRDLMTVTYEVKYMEGAKVEFRKDGEWKDVDCQRDTVPAAIVPQAIATFIAKNYQGTYICKIERDKKGYDVELNNGLDLTFDTKFRLVKIDD